nr:DUF523 domain-containing protein [Butyrivibrio sp. Su6]
MVSACLLGQNCKYSGGNNYSEKVAEYIKGHEVISVCPEVAGGLPTPRIPWIHISRHDRRLLRI